MVVNVDAVYEGGVLRPVEPLPFKERQRVRIRVTVEVVEPVYDNPRTAEGQWLKRHYTEYLGQWVALDGDRLITHGRNSVEVHSEARRLGVADPLLVHLPESGLPLGGSELW